MRSFFVWLTGCMYWIIGPAMSQETARVGYTETGNASYYQDNRGGAYTRSGEPYNMRALEAAHRHIAFNSLVKVTHLGNGRSIVVRINDRPFSSDRVLELTKAAADSLQFKESTSEVKIEVIALGVPRNAGKLVENAYREVSAVQPEKPRRRHVYENEDEPLASTETTSPDNVAKEANKSTKETSKTAKETNKPNTVAAKPTQPKAEPVKPAPDKNAKVRKKPFEATGTYTLKGEEVKPAGYGLQTGAFSELANALKEGREIENYRLGKVFIQVGWTAGKVNYRVLVGTFRSKNEAEKTISALKNKKFNPMLKKHFEN